MRHTWDSLHCPLWKPYLGFKIRDGWVLSYLTASNELHAVCWKLHSDHPEEKPSPWAKSGVLRSGLSCLEGGNRSPLEVVWCRLRAGGGDRAMEGIWSHWSSHLTDVNSQVTLLVKNLPANAEDVRDVGLMPGSGRSAGDGNGNPLQCSCLESPMDRGAWWARVLGVTQRPTRLSD